MKNKNKFIIILAVLCVITSAVMTVSLINTNTKDSKFIPPEFDSSALTDFPNIPANLGWSELSQTGMNYSVGICGNIVSVQNSSDVYFTNTATNTVWLKLRIIDLNGEIISETGLIKPGEYIKTILFNRDITETEKVKIKIMAYEPETYYSEGSVVLNTSIQVGG